MCKVCEDIYVYLQYLNEVHYEMFCLMKLWALHIWKRLTLKSISPTIISK